MSAAPPLPPPGPPRRDQMQGYSNGDGAGDGRAPGALYPPVAKIVATAEERVNELSRQPIGRLLEHAKHHFRSAKMRLDTRQSAAAAYWEYLVAYQLAVDAIPRHPDYYDRIDQSRSQMHREYRDLMKDMRTSEERFVRIKNIIANDNSRNGAQQPPSRTSSAASHYTNSSRTDASSSPVQTAANGVAYRRDDELMLPDVPSGPPLSHKAKPQVNPKPQSLHGRALHQSSGYNSGLIENNDLAERFAKLRGPSKHVDTASGMAAQDLSVKMPSPSEYHSSSRPLGPRDMLPSIPPTQPPKLPLNTELAASMPKEPSPTYSPARNLSLPEGINPPRSSARSVVGTGGRSNSMQASSASAYPPHANGDAGSYFPPAPGIRGNPATRRISSMSRPAEDQIPVEKFYDYNTMYNILVIDVRSREEFDSGHLYVRSIMCIEPTTLQEGISAEQLQDRLILSPDEEQAMFERRNEYDLVVYYNESTKSSAFLRKHDLTEKELALKRLYETLQEFNTDKPLRRPPIFLMGGIDAWTDMLGVQGLKVSATSAIVATKQTKPTPAIKRGARNVHSAKLNLHKRPLREYTPMDPEEEQKLVEEARRGRAVIEHPDDGDDEESTSPLYPSTEEFLRRFPAVETEQQSMVYPPSRPPPPHYAPPAIPVAPSRPAPSVPRVSYSGVHERQATPQGRMAQPPVYVAHGRFSQIRLHRTGLVNFGVTCYMNSVIQCLSANAEFSSIFLSGQYEKDLQKENWKGTKGILPEAYATLVSNLYKGDVSAVRPSTFRKVCGHFNSQWTVDEQQDAKEFLEFVLDHLHEDLNVTWNKPPLKQLTESEELTREKFPRPYVARIEWNRYQHRENSLIGNLFAGQHASRLTCMTCGVTSTTYEAFWSISVEIPRDRPADLRDCLRSYCSNERLSGDEVWRCPRCKRDREAMKKITITRAPDSLVIHFKRFSASHTERAHKVRTPINFPLRGLDLGPFMEPPVSPEQEAYIMQHARDAPAQLTALKTDPTMNGPFIYNAYAVIWHIGSTLGSGHYIAHVKDKARGCWRYFDDAKAVDFDPGTLPSSNRLQNEKAYIVFYERERVAGGVL